MTMNERAENFKNIFDQITPEEREVLRRGSSSTYRRGALYGLLSGVGTILALRKMAPNMSPMRQNLVSYFAAAGGLMIGIGSARVRTMMELAEFDSPVGEWARQQIPNYDQLQHKQALAQQRRRNWSPQSSTQTAPTEFVADTDHHDHGMDKFVDERESEFSQREMSDTRDTMADLRSRNRQRHDAYNQRYSSPSSYSSPPPAAPSSPPSSYAGRSSRRPPVDSELLQDSGDFFGSAPSMGRSTKKGGRYNDEGFE